MTHYPYLAQYSNQTGWNSQALVCEECCRALALPGHPAVEGWKENLRVAWQATVLIFQAVGAVFLGIIVILYWLASVFRSSKSYEQEQADLKKYEEEKRRELEAAIEEGKDRSHKLNDMAKSPYVAEDSEIKHDDRLVTEWNDRVRQLGESGRDPDQDYRELKKLASTMTAERDKLRETDQKRRAKGGEIDTKQAELCGIRRDISQAEKAGDWAEHDSLCAKEAALYKDICLLEAEYRNI